MHDVLMSWGYGADSAATGPLVIDGLMIISGFALPELIDSLQDMVTGHLFWIRECGHSIIDAPAV